MTLIDGRQLDPHGDGLCGRSRKRAVGNLWGGRQSERAADAPSLADVRGQVRLAIGSVARVNGGTTGQGTATYGDGYLGFGLDIAPPLLPLGMPHEDD